jgi:hypothetical protein
MAATFPLAAADLVDRMMVEAVEWQLVDNQELSGTGAGEWIAALLGPALWQADVSSVEADFETIERLRARFLLLDGAIQNFMLYDPARPGPATDPAGAALDGETVTIESIEANRKELSLAGLPADMALPEGTRLSVSAGSPARTFLGVLAADVAADSEGDAGPVEVRPHLRPWLAAGQTVTLWKPAAKVKLVTGSLKVTQVTSVTSRLRFSARQTLAAG